MRVVVGQGSCGVATGAKKTAAELEKQMPKEGEWIDENRRTRSSKFVCSTCKRTCYDIQPTRDKAWTKRCRYNYCPNCGAARQENRNVCVFCGASLIIGNNKDKKE